MPDTSASQTLIPVAVMFIAALGVLVAAAGLIYWALHNLGRDLRAEMQDLRTEMRDGFRRMEDILMRHQHDDDGFPIITGSLRADRETTIRA